MNIFRKFNFFFTSFIVLIFSISNSKIIAQTNGRQADIRPNTIDEIRQRQFLRNNKSLGRPVAPSFAQSDLGIQRPVESKTRDLLITSDLEQNFIIQTTPHRLIVANLRKEAEFGRMLLEPLSSRCI